MIVGVGAALEPVQRDRQALELEAAARPGHALRGLGQRAVQKRHLGGGGLRGDDPQLHARLLCRVDEPLGIADVIRMVVRVHHGRHR